MSRLIGQRTFVSCPTGLGDGVFIVVRRLPELVTYGPLKQVH